MRAKDINHFEALLETAERNASSAWERDFMEIIREKYDLYEEEMFVSDKQLEQLQRIVGSVK
jgi:hypothetical protein